MSNERCSEPAQEPIAETSGESTAESSGVSCCTGNKLAFTYGALLLRLWLAVRALQTGFEKYAAVKQLPSAAVKVGGVANEEGIGIAGSAKQYAMANYHGVPEGLMKKFIAEPMMKLPGPLEMWVKEFYRSCGGKIDGVKLAANPEAWDKFATEPALLHFYDFILGPALIILGFTILIGLANRTSLFLLGLVYISLTWGLILIKQDDGVSWLGIHMILVVMALALAEHNRFTILKKW